MERKEKDCSFRDGLKRTGALLFTALAVWVIATLVLLSGATRASAPTEEDLDARIEELEAQIAAEEERIEQEVNALRVEAATKAEEEVAAAMQDPDVMRMATQEIKNGAQDIANLQNEFVGKPKLINWEYKTGKGRFMRGFAPDGTSWVDRHYAEWPYHEYCDWRGCIEDDTAYAWEVAGFYSTPAIFEDVDDSLYAVWLCRDINGKWIGSCVSYIDSPERNKFFIGNVEYSYLGLEETPIASDLNYLWCPVETSVGS